MLKQQITARGDVRRLAEACGVTPPYISLILSGQRRVGADLADKLGLRPVSGFVRKAGGTNDALVALARRKGIDAAAQAYDAGLALPVLAGPQEFGVDGEQFYAAREGVE